MRGGIRLPRSSGSPDSLHSNSCFILQRLDMCNLMINLDLKLDLNSLYVTDPKRAILVKDSCQKKGPTATTITMYSGLLYIT